MARAPASDAALRRALADQFCRALRDGSRTAPAPAAEPLDALAENLRRETIEGALQNLRAARASGDPRELTAAVQASTTALKTCGYDRELRPSSEGGVEVVVKEADLGDDEHDAVSPGGDGGETAD